MLIQLENAENRAVMTAIRYALDESLRSNRRPFVLVYEYAETIGSDLLREVAAVMQQHEQGADVEKALTALRDSIGRRMKSRILQRIERRKLALLGISAVAVLVGVVVHILYVAIVGGRVWDIVSGAIG
jgi:activator of 2-hydroxyglutaryl-CoA dehydratase